MENLFAEYYRLSDERIKEIWEDSVIVFDTNVLLNLYRYNEDTCKEFIKVIEFYKNRLWIPYQVGFEFHRRREDIIRKNAAAYKTLGAKLSESLIKAVDALSSDFSRHPYINMSEIRKKVEKCANTIVKSLEKQEESHPDYLKDDFVLNEVTRLFNGRVGTDFSEEDLEKTYKEGEKRYSNQIPPGYCDAKNKKDKGNRSLYGDLIVWLQTISYSKEQKRNIIFVTDDHKPDWWDKVEGNHTPRKELIKEFVNTTECGIIIYDSSRFLEYAKRNKELKISKKTLNDVVKIKFDDINYSRLQEYIKELNTSEYILPLSKLDFNYRVPSELLEQHLSSIRQMSENLNVHSRLQESLKPLKELQDNLERITKFNNVNNILNK